MGEGQTVHVISATPKILMMPLAPGSHIKHRFNERPRSVSVQPQTAARGVEQCRRPRRSRGSGIPLLAPSPGRVSNTINYREIYGPSRFHHLLSPLQLQPTWTVNYRPLLLLFLLQIPPFTTFCRGLESPVRPSTVPGPIRKEFPSSVCQNPPKDAATQRWSVAPAHPGGRACSQTWI